MKSGHLIVAIVLSGACAAIVGACDTQSPTQPTDCVLYNARDGCLDDLYDAPDYASTSGPYLINVFRLAVVFSVYAL